MARIEGTYRRYLKTIPKRLIKTLSPKESQKIDMAIGEAFSKKIVVARQKQRCSLYLMREHFLNVLEKIK